MIRVKSMNWMALALSLSVLLSLLFVPRAEAAIGTTFGAPVDLGPKIKSATSIAIYDSVVGVEDGVNMLYTVLAGEPAQFNVINLDTYAVVRTIPLPSAKDSWSMVVAPNGYVYIAATGGYLYRYSQSTKLLEELGVIKAGESAIYGLSSDEAGNIYGGTYPNAIVWKFDPAARRFSDYGRMSDTNSYVRSLAYHNGSLYAGIGTSGALVKLNPDTGQKTPIELPAVTGATYGNYPFVYQLDAVDKYLFAHLSGGGISTLIVYDMELERWRPEQFPNFHGNRVSQAMNGKAYFKLNATGGNKLVELDLATFATRETSMVQGFSMKGGGWVNFADQAAFPGPTLVNTLFNGEIGLFNIQTETYTAKPAILEGQPIPIHALEKGPNGKLYMSGYPGGSAAVYDPATGVNQVFTMGQAESIGFIGSNTLFNTYPHAEIYQLDNTRDIGSGNPVKLFTIGEEQDRPYVNITVGSKMYMGTIPDYGKLGGALVEYDSAAVGSVKHKVYRNVVQDQSIVGLAHKDGKIYGSTTILGGLDSEPTATAAKMFIWDAATGQKIKEFAPVLPGAAKAPRMISGLTFGSDGLLWAAADGTIFAINPDTQAVVKSKEIYPGVTGYGMWRPIHLRWGTDGLLYTDLYGKLTIVNPLTMEHRSLGINTPLFTLGDDGNMYYADSTHLMMIPVTPGNNGGPVVPETNVYNGSFEMELVNGQAPGWSLLSQPSANTSYSYSSEQASGGTRSLKITDTSTTESILVGSDPIAILPGESYNASAKLYIDTGRTSFLFRFYDADGKQTGSDLVTHISTGLKTWQDVQLTGKAPANAKTARVFASVSLLYTTTSYYDDFQLTGKFPDTAAKAGTLKLDIPGATTEKNSLLPVKVKVENANQLYAVTASVYYDPAKFTVDQVSVADAFKNGNEVFFQYNTATPGQVKLVASQLGDHVISGNADIAVITLKAVQAGTTEVTLSKFSKLAKADADQTGKADSPEQDIKVSVQIVQDLSDVNEDGTVNMIDLVIVAKSVGGAYNAKHDLNNDHKVDVQDLAVLSLRLLQ
ncbi:Carbohydrate binding domain-containing protein [Paenibacillus sp. UNCCL117]|uniref:cohesin domain-containing protein n=1 Tax=unclassified Paenibacillus TaxID=185978 RepID=UPI0008835C93|nr:MULTISPECIES: cohesin domain-containing protein [unclassified Paenibacillus]SDD65306.1 Carbohydrate binding domain-containing protein [Paenibacillus sp. cl123]SFW58148.1 Carbohydrate binding domain-containing protein [Paenibacillus sp. UNCCL117]